MNWEPVGFTPHGSIFSLFPAAETVPGEVQVTAISLSDGAAGLAMGEELTITEGKTAMTITAKDGSTHYVFTF